MTEKAVDEGIAIAAVVVLLVVFFLICSYCLYAMKRIDPIEEEIEKHAKQGIINGLKQRRISTNSKFKHKNRN